MDDDLCLVYFSLSRRVVCGAALAFPPALMSSKQHHPQLNQSAKLDYRYLSVKTNRGGVTGCGASYNPDHGRSQEFATVEQFLFSSSANAA